MQAFNPTAPAFDVIQAGLVVEDLHRSLYRNLAARADLEPGSRQLLVGGVGSGKTTELLLAIRWTEEHANLLPFYFDISEDTDLSTMTSGVLLASSAVRLGLYALKGPGSNSRIDERANKLEKNFDRAMDFAYGTEVEREVNRLYSDAFVSGPLTFQPGSERRVVVDRIPGKLNPPLPALERDIRAMQAPISEFMCAIREATQKDVVVIFDGLDRLLDANKFWSVVYQDLRILRDLKVSVIATAPLSVLFGVGIGQSISDHFDKVHHLTVIPADPVDASLWSVLLKRGGIELLSAPLPSVLCAYSGGVLRDLISLARDAAEEAYVADRDSITLADIEKVAHQLGNSYLRGLGPEAIQTLLKLESTKSIDLNQAANVELLLTRRVLEYSSTDFRVHPALLSVIPRPEPTRA
jgi:hypothetical protein